MTDGMFVAGIVLIWLVLRDIREALQNIVHELEDANNKPEEDKHATG